jgi:hypothetical protein
MKLYFNVFFDAFFNFGNVNTTATKKAIRNLLVFKVKEPISARLISDR